MPNPFAGFPVTDDWAAHRARGSLGGVDYGTPVGTPIYAPNPGYVSYEYGSGSGGYIITLALSNSPGYKMQFLHCSSFEGTNRNVNEGDLLGYTGGAAGAPGAGSSTGAHVHVHLVDPNGNREDVQPWFGNYGVSGGGSGSTPAAGVDYAEVQTLLAGRGFYSGAIDGEFGRQSWTAVQNLVATFGFMDANYIDGIPGSRTYTGMQLYAQKNDNYRGKVDGIVGPMTWAGFVQSLREDAPKPTPTPAPKPEPKPEPVKPVPTPEPKPEPVVPTPVPDKPVKPAKPTRPTRPTKPAKPVKEPTVPNVTPLPDAANNAAHDALGILIPQAKNRKMAYAIYGLVSLIVSNAAVGIVASGVQAPAWLIVLLAVVGNLAAPFATLAIANAGNSSK